MERFFLGTAGWSYKDWVGPFYEPGTTPGEFLAAYTKRFGAVEVDSTFYRIPTRAMVEGWNRVTPDGFLFSPKMVRDVTHDRFLGKCGDLVREYLDAFEPLGDKLGPIILQFPYFKRDTGINLDIFLGRLLPFLGELDDPTRFAVEIRNRDFLRPPLFEGLRKHGVPLVLVDHAYMPPPRGWGKLEGALTTDRVPIRLIGDRYGIEKVTKTWEKEVLDQRPRLARWAELIRRALADGKTVTAFVNNHYAGHGPATAVRLREMVEAAGD
jgi:uncharacterized protein YecE (DUF72 family)